MKTCPNCQFENPEESGFCTKCGAPLDGQPAYQPFAEPKVNPYDHTKDFDAEDIKDTKLFAMGCYLLSFAGVLLALLANKKSPYLQFHIRQAMKIILLDVALGLAAGLLAITVVVPIAAGILLLILQVVRLLCFIDVCKNKALEPWLVRNLAFLD